MNAAIRQVWRVLTRPGIQAFIGVTVCGLLLLSIARAVAPQPTHPAVAAATQTPTPLPTATPTPAPDISLSVHGTQIYEGGQSITLVGAARYSLEFECGGDGHFQLQDFQAMRSWGMNTVRIPLSSFYWRNSQCPDYAHTIASAVQYAEAAGLYVILDLQRSSPLGTNAQCPLPGPADLTFWQELATTYRDDPHILFDLFGEPYNVSAGQWEHGGPITTACFPAGRQGTYQAIGMPALAAAVRAVAPHNLILLSGLGWGYDLSEIQPVDLPGILYATHPWNHGNYEEPWDWARAFGNVATSLPVIASEFGAYDCQTGYISREIADFEQLHMSFLAWAWTPGDCGVPGLIADWSGTPTTPYGRFIQQQILQAAARDPLAPRA